MLPDFNRLRVFFHVRATGRVSEAAAVLGVTQSAVSQSLAKLEAEVGAQLFVRRHRRLVPTAAGDELFGVVAPFVEQLRDGVERIHRERHELVGELRLGAPVEFGAHRLAPVLASFRGQHPAVRFSLMLGHPSQVVPALEQGRLDVAFADLYEPRAVGPTGLEVLGVMDEALVLVASPEYERQVLQGSRAQARLAAASFVAYEARAPAIRGWFRHHFERVPARLDLALVVESVQAVIVAAQHGLGLGVVPRHTVAAAIERGSLVEVRTRRRPLTNRVSMLRVLDKVPSRAERALVAHLRAELRVEIERGNPAASR